MSSRQRNRSGSAGDQLVRQDILEEPLGGATAGPVIPEETPLPDPCRIDCCLPSGCLLNEPIDSNDLSEAQKVICNNESCSQSAYMHNACFSQFEIDVVSYLKISGRARSWSDKQRRQNVWTKKGYDLSYKACGCRCLKGHLRKDLDWLAPQPMEVALRRKKKKKMEKSSVSGTSLGRSPRQRTVSEQSTGTTGSSASRNDSPEGALPTPSPSKLLRASPTLGGDTVATPSPPTGGGGLLNSAFLRRMDFSSFQGFVPKSRLNPFCIKMECEDGPGDDTRLTVFQALTAQHTNNVQCLGCAERLFVFDRYPLIDGTFFLSPIPHHLPAIPVVYNERNNLFLMALCLHCIEGQERSIVCRHCAAPWDGSTCQLGTLYYYDILAAQPCCARRLACNRCGESAVDPATEGMSYYSEYSHCVRCPGCGTTDHHFVKEFQSSFQIRQLKSTSKSPGL